jgi:hypothetical protein
MVETPGGGLTAEVLDGGAAFPPFQWNSRWLRLGVSAALVFVVVCGAAFRVRSLNHIPGMYGDEAYLAIEADRLAHGKSFVRVTTAGNHMNPGYLAEIAVLGRLHPEPAIWLVRATAVIDGLLFLVLTYWLLRPCIGRQAATLAAIAFAAFPVTIIYSRIAYLSSETCWMFVISLALALRRRYAWAAAVLVFSVVFVEPANIFLAPVLAGIAAAPWLSKWNNYPIERRRKLLLFGGGGLVVAALLVLAVIPRLGLVRWWKIPWADAVLRLRHPGWMVDYVRDCGRLFSGVNIYEAFVTPIPRAARWAHELLFWTLAAPLAVVGTLRLIRARRWAHLGMEAGLLASLVCLYFISAGAMHPGYERWTMFCTVTGVILGAIWLDVCIPHRDWARALVLVIGCLWIAAFHVYFFRAIERTGGSNNRSLEQAGQVYHLMFETGAVDPKEAALEIVRKQCPQGPVVILAPYYLLGDTIRYLALREDRISVYDMASGVPVVWNYDASLSIPAARAPGTRVFALKFVDDPPQKPLPAPWIVRQEWTLRSYSGTPVLSLQELEFSERVNR